MAVVGAAIGKLTNRLETLKEATYIGIAIFVATAVVITLISPRAQSPQLGGNIENVLAGPLNKTGTIAVFTVDVVNSGTMQSIIKNWSVTATVNSINYRGSILVPPPPNLTFNDPDAPTGAPRAITFHGQDSLLDKASVPIPTGGETTGLLFIVFNGIDPGIFKAGVDYTVSFEDALSKTYTLRITSTAQKGPIALASEHEGKRFAIFLAGDDDNAALAGLVDSEATVNPVFLVIGGANMAAKIRAVNRDFARYRSGRFLGGEGFADFMRKDEGGFVLHVQISAQLKRAMAFGAVHEDGDCQKDGLNRELATREDGP